MYVKDYNAPTRGLRVPGMSKKYREGGLDIPEHGVVQVDKKTGAALIEHCPTIREHNAKEDN